jgi:transposase
VTEEEKVDKWEMYMEIQQLLKQGFSKVKVAEKLGISRTTVYRYIKRNPKTMSEWVENTKTRKKKLDDYKAIILSWLQQHPDMSAAQVLDWLQEKYEVDISESTVRLYVRELRKEYDIPKELESRAYEAVPEKPFGSQMQVDFGQTEQLTPDGKKVKLRFIAFVLANSRYKYKEWLDRPFTTRDVIQAHENAFHYYGGIPDELVYDQDALILVSENGGDLILTREFQAYKEERKLNIHVCRKADPESKGKVENVVKYIKHNFAKHRIYYGLDTWNENGLKWLKRTGNYKHHNTTKKRPVEVFALEKQHLRPVSSPIENYFDSNNTSSIARTVRKDNTIWYKSNRYSVPLGTFHKSKQVHIETTDEEYLIIVEPDTGEIIGKHKIETDKGKLIQDTNHRRDRTKGIDEYINTVASAFSDKKKAVVYLETIRERRSRYIRDQLQTILKQIKTHEQKVIDSALVECVDKHLFSATEFVDMVQYLNQQRDVTVTEDIKNQDINLIHPYSDSVLQTDIHKRDVQEYVSVLEGDVR